MVMLGLEAKKYVGGYASLCMAITMMKDGSFVIDECGNGGEEQPTKNNMCAMLVLPGTPFMDTPPQKSG